MYVRISKGENMPNPPMYVRISRGENILHVSCCVFCDLKKKNIYNIKKLKKQTYHCNKQQRNLLCTVSKITQNFKKNRCEAQQSHPLTSFGKVKCLCFGSRKILMLIFV